MLHPGWILTPPVSCCTRQRGETEAPQTWQEEWNVYLFQNCLLKLDWNLWHPELETLALFPQDSRQSAGLRGLHISSWCWHQLLLISWPWTSFKSRLRASEWFPGKALCSPSNLQWSQAQEAGSSRSGSERACQCRWLCTSREEHGAGSGGELPFVAALRHWPQKTGGWGTPDGAVPRSLPANAGHPGSIPGLGGFHALRNSCAPAPQLLTPRSGAHAPQLLSLSAQSLCSATGEAPTRRSPHSEKPTHHNKEKAHRNQRKPSWGNKDPVQTKINT